MVFFFYKLYETKMKILRTGILLVVFCTLPGSENSCGRSEYKSAAGECCPMCGTGSIVRSDCSGDSSTTCKPCPSGTFMNEPNGLHNCFPCKNCAEDQGLYMQSKCTTMHDSICDVLDDHYCIDLSNQQCSHAVKHSVCKAGQETKTKGTKTTDTVCVDCAPGFYSSSGIPCIKWTKSEESNKGCSGNWSF
ncbi:tumor necrosis factor receptor superfamily member 14-like isoform X3 [Danio aesculapii]|uniref:tumor necrosis factor receptor superfamily member 14-like isoform X3 n=1 Tax=Danio aesculapii TaxID=1142201 RepID=UPI0024BFAC75|nr:tumor necrosis factor receptor superfamily member 14-like isoform X3 [Danio aesculapii]